MCPSKDCEKCPADGLSCAASKDTGKFSDSAAAQHMKRHHRPQPRRNQAQWEAYLQTFLPAP